MGIIIISILGAIFLVDGILRMPSPAGVFNLAIGISLVYFL